MSGQKKEEMAGQAAGCRPETVLLVEDEAGVRDLTREILKLQGYEVLEAGDGREALGLAEARADPIHLLLTDVMMPKLNGFQLFKHLREKRPGLKVVFMSGHIPGAVLRGYLAGANTPFIQKPFAVARLAGKVREMLDFPGDPAAGLDLNIFIPRSIECTPEFVTWKVGEKLVVRTLRVVTQDAPFRITAVQSSNNGFMVEWREIREGREYQVRVSPVHTREPMDASLWIQIDAPQGHPRSFTAWAMVRL